MKKAVYAAIGFGVLVFVFNVLHDMNEHDARVKVFQAQTGWTVEQIEAMQRADQLDKK
jgi:hypothetical protein